MKKHTFLVSVAAAASALVGTADAAPKTTETTMVDANKTSSPNIQQIQDQSPLSFYDVGDERHAFLMKPSESGLLFAMHRSHQSHSSHSSHSSHRSGY